MTMTQTELVMKEQNIYDKNLTCHVRMECQQHKLNLSWKNRKHMTQT